MRMPYINSPTLSIQNMHYWLYLYHESDNKTYKISYEPEKHAAILETSVDAIIDGVRKIVATCWAIPTKFNEKQLVELQVGVPRYIIDQLESFFSWPIEPTMPILGARHIFDTNS